MLSIPCLSEPGGRLAEIALRFPSGPSERHMLPDHAPILEAAQGMTGHSHLEQILILIHRALVIIGPDNTTGILAYHDQTLRDENAFHLSNRCPAFILRKMLKNRIAENQSRTLFVHNMGHLGKGANFTNIKNWRQ